LFDIPLFLRRQMVGHVSIVAAVTILNTGLALLLVPSLGVQGAAIGYCVAALAGCGISFLAVRGFTRMMPNRRTLLGVSVGCASMMAVSLSVVAPDIGRIALAVGCGASLYFAVLWLLDVSDVRDAPRRVREIVFPAAR